MEINKVKKIEDSKIRKDEKTEKKVAATTSYPATGNCIKMFDYLSF